MRKELIRSVKKRRRTWVDKVKFDQMKVATSRPAYVNFQLATKLFKFQPLGLVNSFSESESFLIFPVFKSVNSSSCYLWDNTRGWFRRGRKRNTVWKYIQWSLDYLNCQNRILVAPAISRKRITTSTSKGQCPPPIQPPSFPCLFYVTCPN